MLNVGELVATLSVRFERNIDILVPLKKKNKALRKVDFGRANHENPAFDSHFPYKPHPSPF